MAGFYSRIEKVDEKYQFVVQFEDNELFYGELKDGENEAREELNKYIWFHEKCSEQEEQSRKQIELLQYLKRNYTR